LQVNVNDTEDPDKRIGVASCELSTNQSGMSLNNEKEKHKLYNSITFLQILT